jgi:hypothetical protein
MYCKPSNSNEGVGHLSLSVIALICFIASVKILELLAMVLFEYSFKYLMPDSH